MLCQNAPGGAGGTPAGPTGARGHGAIDTRSLAEADGRRIRPEPLSGEHGGGQDARIGRRGGVSPGQPTGRWSQDAGARWLSPATGSRQTAALARAQGTAD